MMKISPLQIGDLTVPVPILQGAMGIGVSMSQLAAAVSKEGGVGVLAGVQMGYGEKDFFQNPLDANERAMRQEIRTVRSLAPKGIMGVNIMTAVNHYRKLVQAAVEEGVDLIVSGAGLPAELPALVKGSKTKIIPIVSSGKAAALIAKMWDRKHSRIPDAMVVEGPEAGGHLGFSMEQLTGGSVLKLEDLVKEVLEAIRPMEEKYRQKIPVIAAGGIFDGIDIARFLKLGAAGVQMATRFVATFECDAHPSYKEAYLNAKESDIGLVQSPVGMPGRAVITPFVHRSREGRIPVTRCTDCLKPCDPADTPYCISDALMEAVKGNVADGLVFAGSNAHRLHKLVSVKELMAQLVAETEEALTV